MGDVVVGEDGRARCSWGASTPEYRACLFAELRRRGFVFVGPATVYAARQALGVVNDHLAGCSFR